MSGISEYRPLKFKVESKTGLSEAEEKCLRILFDTQIERLSKEVAELDANAKKAWGICNPLTLKNLDKKLWQVPIFAIIYFFLYPIGILVAYSEYHEVIKERKLARSEFNKYHKLLCEIQNMPCPIEAGFVNFWAMHDHLFTGLSEECILELLVIWQRELDSASWAPRLSIKVLYDKKLKEYGSIMREGESDGFRMYMASPLDGVRRDLFKIEV
jgi:hypothetical protein